MKISEKILLVLNVILVFITLIAYLSPYTDPSKIWYFIFFGIIFIPLLALNILFIFYWFFKWKKWILISVLTLVVGHKYLEKTIGFKRPEMMDKSGISVMSFNVNQGYYMYEHKIDNSELVDFIIEKNPDILLLQELNTQYIKDVIRNLKQYNNRVIFKDIGAGILSKYPCIKSGNINLGYLTNSCVWSDIVIKKDTIRFFSVHFKSNQITKDAQEIVDGLENERKLETKNVKVILHSYKNNTQIRAGEVKQISDFAKKSPHKVIIGGDFNDPPISYTYRKFNEFLDDAFNKKGNGLGITYGGVIPFLRIDYIFTDPKIEVKGFNTFDRKLSDHYPVYARIKI